jgi:hypothetical protein
VKGNIVQSLIQHIEEVNYIQEVNLISILFPREHYEDSKFISIALAEINKRTRDLKESLVKRGNKRDDDMINTSVETINKLIYLICVHECRNALTHEVSPSLIQGREQWSEI